MRHATWLSEYEASGAGHTLFEAWTFVDEHVFLTKTRALGAVLRLTGVDYECLDPVDRAAVVRRWTTALRMWDEQHRVYQFLIKSRHPAIQAELPAHPIARRAVEERLAWFARQREDLYALELYAVVLWEGWASTWTHTATDFARHPLRAFAGWLRMRDVVSVVDDELTHGIAAFGRRLDAWQLQLAETIGPTLLPASDAYRVLWRLANYRSDVNPPAYRSDVPLDCAVAHEPIECYRDHLRVGDAFVRGLTLRQPPSQTWAHQLEVLYAVPAPMIVAIEWQRQPTDAVRRRVHAMRRHHHTAQVSWLTYFMSHDPAAHEVLVDDSAGAMVSTLGQALTALELEDQYFGRFAMTVVVHERDRAALDHACAEVLKAFATIDAVATEETYNGLNAWLAIMPGNGRRQLRSLLLLNTNAADLALLFTLHTGDPWDAHLQREYLALLETTHHAPFYLSLRYHDVGHMACFGATGAGKTFLMNFLLTHVMKYDPRVLIFDMGNGYAKLTEHFGGSYLPLTLEPSGVTINPFCLPPTRDNLAFLVSFVQVLLAQDRPQLTAREEHELHEQVGDLYSLDPSLRRLATLVDMLPRSLEPSLRRWVHDGPYASVFDHSTDTLTFAPFQAISLGGLHRHRGVLEPLLYYILHRATADVEDPARAQQVKVCAMDEVWWLLTDDRIVRFVTRALKTWRKHNASLWLCTQAPEDFLSAKLLRPVIESCLHCLFLANPGLDDRAYEEFFRLNQTERALVRDLLPRQQLLLKRPDYAKVLTLRVDEASRWLYSHTATLAA